jgi:hypothetical protein
MRWILKRALLWCYCAGWISIEACQRVYDRFDLRSQ